VKQHSTARRRSTNVGQPAAEVRQAATWREYFFQCTRNPVSVSNLIVALAAGTPLQVDRIPPELLAPVVLLSTVGLRVFQQQIVDDYVALFNRMEELWKDCDVTLKLPNGESMQFLHLNPVSGLIMDGPRNADYFIGDLPELRYVEQMYHEMVEDTPENLYEQMNKEAKVLR